MSRLQILVCLVPLKCSQHSLSDYGCYPFKLVVGTRGWYPYLLYFSIATSSCISILFGLLSHEVDLFVISAKLHMSLFVVLAKLLVSLDSISLLAKLLMSLLIS